MYRGGSTQDNKIMNNLQHTIFKEGEADAWFARNKDVLVPKRDLFFNTLKNFVKRGDTVLDVGCSNGYRLQPLHEIGAQCSGVDPSEKAIEFGSLAFPDIHLETGTADDLPMPYGEEFDIVLVSFVFHWVDRAFLFKSFYEVERCVKPGGILVIQDFCPPAPVQAPYKHKQGAYTYKQDYSEPFVASGLYERVQRVHFQHGKNISSAIRNDDTCAISILKKL